jgi:hypothetical protein
MGGLVLPQLVVSSAESVEVVQPALMRLEAEGGLLLIEVRAWLFSFCPVFLPVSSADALGQSIIKWFRSQGRTWWLEISCRPADCAQ